MDIVDRQGIAAIDYSHHLAIYHTANQATTINLTDEELYTLHALIGRRLGL